MGVCQWFAHADFLARAHRNAFRHAVTWTWRSRLEILVHSRSMRNRAHHAFILFPFKSSLYLQSKRAFSSFVGATSVKQPVDNKSFSKTLRLPKTSFPLWTDPSKSEAPFQERTGEKLYRWQVLIHQCDCYARIDNETLSGRMQQAPYSYSMMARRTPMATFT